MITRSARLSMALCISLFGGGLAIAQQPTAAERDALEPAARAAVAAPGAATPSIAPANPAAAAAAPAATGAGAASKKAQRPATGRAGAATQHSATASDRVDLDTSTVTGNQELPKVMYIVPWKKSEIGDLAGRPMNSLLDEVLAPVDRDVFRREVTYYDAVKAEAPPGGAPVGGSGKP
jgi:hypothetical protein